MAGSRVVGSWSRWRRVVVLSAAVEVVLMLVVSGSRHSAWSGPQHWSGGFTVSGSAGTPLNASSSSSGNETRGVLLGSAARSAMARQYATLSGLEASGSRRPTGWSGLAAYERQVARSASTRWLKYKRELRRRCLAAAASGEARRGVRWFTTSERKDFAGYVSEELAELGLCFVPANETRWPLDFYVGEQFESENAPRWAGRARRLFARNASVGAVEGLMAIFGSKDSYAQLFWHCKDATRRQTSRRVLCPNAWLPSFNVFGDENERSDKFRRNVVTKHEVPYFDRLFALARGAAAPTWWIVKPQKGTFLSRGMHLSLLTTSDVNSRNAMLSWIANNVVEPGCKERKVDRVTCARRMVTFQIYVHKPALFHDRKFDMRFWVVVASVDPLRLYLLRHAYPKIASKPFSADPATLGDQCMHIKMLLDPSCNVTLRAFVSKFPYGFPRSTASPVFFQGLSFPALLRQRAAYAGTSPHKYRHDRARPRDWPLKEQFWSRHVWPAVEKALAKVVMLVRANLSAAATRSPYRTFALLSPDLTLDDKGHVYIEEVNTNGLVMGTHAASGGAGNLFFDNAYVRGFLRLVGADGYPRAPDYAPALDAAITAFCNASAANARGCTPRATRAMATAVHEEAHAGRHYYRIYPPISCFERDPRSPCRASSSNAADDPDTPHHWPNQALFTDAEYAAMPESSLDKIVRRFLTTTDTQLIHGVPQVPGHARWPPRELDGALSL
uniref:Tubulin--tyrosine ligase-like protein 9 n=1 Tax=Chrysocystis fragilis TaxID=1411660 RepID=A0A7S0TCK6_9STRA